MSRYRASRLRAGTAARAEAEAGWAPAALFMLTAAVPAVVAASWCETARSRTMEQSEETEALALTGVEAPGLRAMVVLAWYLGLFPTPLAEAEGAHLATVE